jgi:hypothetical protein
MCLGGITSAAANNGSHSATISTSSTPNTFLAAGATFKLLDGTTAPYLQFEQGCGGKERTSNPKQEAEAAKFLLHCHEHGDNHTNLLPSKVVDFMALFGAHSQSDLITCFGSSYSPYFNVRTGDEKKLVFTKLQLLNNQQIKDAFGQPQFKLLMKSFKCDLTEEEKKELGYRQEMATALTDGTNCKDNWAQCKDCKKKRLLPLHIKQSSITNFTCGKNIHDKRRNNCNVPEQSIDDAKKYIDKLPKLPPQPPSKITCDDSMLRKVTKDTLVMELGSIFEKLGPASWSIAASKYATVKKLTSAAHNAACDAIRGSSKAMHDDLPAFILNKLQIQVQATKTKAPVQRGSNKR